MVRCASPRERWATNTKLPTCPLSWPRFQAPNFLLKIIPHVDGTPRICELVKYHLTEIELRGAWTGPAALNLSPHALAPVAELPVLEVVSAIHMVVDLTLALGEVVHDYLAETKPQAQKGRTHAFAD